MDCLTTENADSEDEHVDFIQVSHHQLRKIHFVDFSLPEAIQLTKALTVDITVPDIPLSLQTVKLLSVPIALSQSLTVPAEPVIISASVSLMPSKTLVVEEITWEILAKSSLQITLRSTLVTCTVYML